MGTAALHAPSLASGFVYEDFREISTALEFQGWPAIWELTRTKPLRVLSGLSRDLNVAVFGIQPWSFHLGNLLLHVANVALLYALLRRVVSWPSAWWAAALLAVHPVTVEAVAYVSARADLLSTAGILLALWATSAGSLTGALCGVVLAVLGKETAIVAWGLVPLWATWTATKFPRLIWGLGGLVLAGLVAWNIHLPLAWSGESSAQALVAFWRFLVMLPLPFGFSIEHDWHLWAFLAVPLLIPTVYLTMRTFTDAPTPLWALGWLWTLVVFLPRFVVPLTEGPHERHVYLVLIGWCLCAGYWLDAHAQRKEVSWLAAQGT